MRAKKLFCLKALKGVFTFSTIINKEVNFEKVLFVVPCRSMHTLELTKLKPEDKRALGVLSITLNERGTNPRNYMSQDVWINNRVSTFYAPLSTKSIPSDKEWRWNQTRAKKVAYLENFGAHVTFAKLITRKTRSTTQAIPNYKLWHFTLSFNGRNDSTVVLWCEKGKPESEAAQPTEKPCLPDSNNNDTQEHKLLLSFICN